MKTVALGLLGTTLDRATPANRWNRWRPTVSLCLQENLLIDRFELLHDAHSGSLAGQVVEDMRQSSPATEVRQHILEWRDPWDFEEVYGKLMDFCRTYPFNLDEERYLIHLTTGTHVAQICLFLLTESRHLPGALIQTSPKRGASPSQGSYSIIDLDLSRYDSIAARFHQQAEEGLEFLKGGIPTRNPAFNAMMEEIERVAIRSRAPILIQGPTGSGKTQLARRIHALKKARKQLQGPLVSLNCGTLRGDAALAALFGHTRGAYTGANMERPGLLKAADGGMVFLDEIGELGQEEQSMLLHAIEDKRFRPLGSDHEVESDFQLIAGTHRDLSQAVREGRFRADLLARINLWSYRLPGLSERPEDLEPNLDHECLRYEEVHGGKVRFNQEARQLYLTFATSQEARWEANFRDLGSSLTRMATLAGSGRIHTQIVQDEILRLKSLWLEPQSMEDPLESLFPAERLQEIDPFDQATLREVVRVCRTRRNLSEAGRYLFQASRKRKSSQNDASRLRKFLERFGLDWSSVQAP